MFWKCKLMSMLTQPLTRIGSDRRRHFHISGVCRWEHNGQFVDHGLIIHFHVGAHFYADQKIIFWLSVWNWCSYICLCLLWMFTCWLEIMIWVNKVSRCNKRIFVLSHPWIFLSWLFYCKTLILLGLQSKWYSSFHNSFY